MNGKGKEKDGGEANTKPSRYLLVGLKVLDASKLLNFRIWVENSYTPNLLTVTIISLIAPPVNNLFPPLVRRSLPTKYLFYVVLFAR